MIKQQGSHKINDQWGKSHIIKSEDKQSVQWIAKKKRDTSTSASSSASTAKNLGPHPTCSSSTVTAFAQDIPPELLICNS